MLTIALTSIPPRFGSLTDVTAQLLAQTVPVRVVVSIPRTYLRFPGEVTCPDLPEPVILRRPALDYGPATKLLRCLDDPASQDILYCDDDWAYAPNWAETLVTARASSSEVVASSTFPVTRLKRQATPPFDQVAQGFGGVLVRKEMFDRTAFDLPAAAYAADDIWLSGLLARRQIPIRSVPEARALCAPRPTPGPQLQTSVVDGMSRAQANTACADALTKRFGIWPRQ